jgi:phosphonate transport system substrate-binding protein
MATLPKVLLTLLLLLVFPAAGNGETLTLAVHPYLTPSELVLRFSPLAEYLGDRLGREVVLRISPDYSRHIELIGRDQVDLAYLGPAPYVQMVALHGEKPTLARLVTSGSPTFRGIIIVRRGAPIKDLSDLRGKRFAFGDPGSTMSSLLPRYMLRQAGIGLGDLGGHVFLRNHQNVVLGVLMGQFDAGAVKSEIYDEYRHLGLQALAETPPVSEHLFVAAGNLPPELVRELRHSLLALGETERGREILAGIEKSATALAPVTGEEYRELARILRSLGELRTPAE